MTIQKCKLWNVEDRRHGWVGEWEVSPLSLAYAALDWMDKGRSVIYQNHKKIEVGTITSFNKDFVWVRFGVRGSTSAACKRETLVFAIRPLDGDPLRGILEID